MKNKAVLFGIGLVVGAIVIVLVVMFFHSKTAIAPQPVACTDEAKICPDGSSVGRTGPSCEFAACPSVSTTTSSAPAVKKGEAVIGSTVTQNGVSITPVSVIDDSRCPSDVRCVVAGTTHLSTQLSSGVLTNTVTLELGTPFTFAGKTVTLGSVTPLPSSKTQIAPQDYRFMFTVEGSVSATKGTIKGSVTVGPACPVQQVDNPCTPSPEMYAAQKIAVYTSTDESQLVTTITPDAQGKFSTTLPTGKYYLDVATKHAGVGSVTGLPTSVVINDGAVVEVNISVDTGIR